MTEVLVTKERAAPRLVSLNVKFPRKPAAAAQPRLALFEEMMLPHLDAAYNLARWLTGNPQDAQDVAQEAYLRAFRFFDGFRGGDGKAWLLEIVRNTCRTFHVRRERDAVTVSFDEASHSPAAANAEQQVADRERAGVLAGCIKKLPVDFREVLVLREFEEMSYREIASATGLAIGTVMSRLSRARRRLEDCAAQRTGEVIP